MKNIKPTVLVILDGFGYRKEMAYNAIYHAHTPHIDQWLKQYPHTIVQAAGPAVGLPQGYIGNSEVGHSTIGSGRITPEPVTILHNTIDNGTFFSNKILVKNLKKIKEKGTALHIMGLLSDAGVHSHIKHLFAFLDAAQQHGITKIFVHAFLDGRDTPPQSASTYLRKLDEKLKTIPAATIGSIHGRFYAMDRDNNWKRTEESYHALTEKEEKRFPSGQAVLDEYYPQDITDEFIPPTQLDPESIVQDGDGIIFINFRSDRARQLTASFVEPNFAHFPTKKLALACFITPTTYDESVATDALLKPPVITNTLKDVLVQNGKTIFSIAETEKYAHVTYFFNGGKEEALTTETRVLIPSIPAKNYVAYPHMSAAEITQKILASLQTDPCDFYVINYANADMVAHSGNFDATVQAVECLDDQLEQLYEQVITTMGGTLYVTADHGNAEDMYNKDIEQPRTAHTNNPVRFIMIRENLKGSDEKLPLTQLADIAPFILKNMGLPIPKEMR